MARRAPMRLLGRSIRVVLLCVFLCTVLRYTVAHSARDTARDTARRWFLSPAGTDTSACGTQSSPCATLTYLIATRHSVEDGDVIVLDSSSGPYACENLTVPVAITLQSSSQTQGAVFDCQDTTQAFHFTSTSAPGISLIGLIFQRCYASVGGGGCVQFTNSSAVFLHTTIFSRCSAVGSGGAVLVELTGPARNVSVIIENTIWADCYTINPQAGSSLGSAHGGALAVNFASEANNASVSLRGNNLFSGTLASGRGGAVAVHFGAGAQDCIVGVYDSCTFENTGAELSGQGGALSVFFDAEANRSRVEWNGEHSIAHSAADADGGGVHVGFWERSENCSVEITGASNFSHVRNRGSGGAVAVEFFRPSIAPALVVRGANRFTNVSATNTGGAYAALFYAETQRVHAVVEGTNLFDTTTARLEGGALSFLFALNSSDTHVTLTGANTFRNAVSEGGTGGGGLSVLYVGPSANATVAVDGSNTFQHCRAPATFGGAIHVIFTDESTDADLRICGNQSFIATSGGYGGAVAYVWHGRAARPNIRIHGTHSFIGTSAPQNGGALYFSFFQGSVDSYLVLDGANQFVGTSSILGAGAIGLISNGNSLRAYLAFRGTANFSHTNGGLGGAIYLHYLNTMEEGYVAVQGSYTFEHSSSNLLGGAIAIEFFRIASSSIVIHGNHRFTNCSANEDIGGAIFLFHRETQRVNVTLSGPMVFEGCTALEIGGAVGGLFLGNTSDLSFDIRDGPHFRDCGVSTQGGSVSLAVVAPQASNNRFLLQNVTAEGSYVSQQYGTGGTFYFQCSSDIPNLSAPATTKQGLRAWLHTCETSVRNVSIYGATAAYGGGLAVANGVVNLTDTVLIGANATVAGGGVLLGGTAYALASSLHIEACASPTGSAIRMRSDSTLAVWNASIFAAAVDSSVISAPSAAALAFSRVRVSCAPGHLASESSARFLQISPPWSATQVQCCTSQQYDIRCSACPRYTYSLAVEEREVRAGSSAPSSLTCRAQPYGTAAVGAAAVRALPGFWATRFPDRDTVVAYRCPSGYCCSSASSCPLDAQCGGNREGTLCGSCRAGYSQAYGTTACTRSDECGKSYFIPVGMLLAVAAVVWFVVPRRAHSSGITEATFFFYQIAALLLVSTTEEYLWERALASLFNFRVPAHREVSGVLCPFRDLTTAGAVALHLFIPALVLVGIPAATWIAAQLQRRPVRKAQLALAMMSAGIYMYTTLLETVFSLLHCVPIAGARRLFLAATTTCYQPWQYALLPICIVLYAIPVVAIMWQRGTLPARSSASLAVREALEAPFRPAASAWEAVTMLRRLILVSVHVFVTNPLARTVTLTVLCLVFLLAHVVYRPFRERRVNVHDAVAQFALVCIAAMNIRNAAYAVEGVVPTGPPAATASDLDTLQATLLLLPILMLASDRAPKWAHAARSWWRRRSASMARPSRLCTTDENAPVHALSEKLLSQSAGNSQGHSSARRRSGLRHALRERQNAHEMEQL